MLTQNLLQQVTRNKKNSTHFLFSFDNLSAERFLDYLLANYAFFNFDLLSIRSLNFRKISALFLIGPFFIIGDCVVILKGARGRRMVVMPTPTTTRHCKWLVQYIGLKHSPVINRRVRVSVQLGTSSRFTNFTAALKCPVYVTVSRNTVSRN